MMKMFTQAALPLLCLYSLNSKAQFSTVWTGSYQHTTSANYSNEGRKVAEDPSGNIFILSDNTSDIDPFGVQGISTYHYVTVAKYSTNGGLLNTLIIEVYNHVTSGFDNEGAFGLQVDAAGNVYIGFTTYDAVTGYNIKLGKYDNSLVRIWTNSYITNGDEKGIDFKVDASGTIYAVVKSTDSQVHYSVIKSVPVSAPAALVYTYPPNSLVITCFDLDGNQTAYLGGYVYKGGYRDAYVGALDVTNGNVLWGSAYAPKGIVGDDIINDITVGIDGNIYSTGTTNQGADGDRILITRNLPGNPRFDFVKILKGFSINTGGFFINASESGWVYIGAASLTAVGYTYVFRIPDNGIYSYPGVIMFDPVPGVAYTSINGITLNAMKISSSKNIYITGGISASGASGDFNCSYLYKASVVFGNALIDGGGMTVDGQVGSNYSGMDLALDYSKTDVYWLRNYWSANHNNEYPEIKDISVPSPLRESTGVSETETFSLTPNPASSTVEVSSNNLITDIEVLDIAGNRVLYCFAGSMTRRIDVSALAQGYYMLKTNTEQGPQVKVLVINK
jgi:hypothetical protein